MRANQISVYNPNINICLLVPFENTHCNTQKFVTLVPKNMDDKTWIASRFPSPLQSPTIAQLTLSSVKCRWLFLFFFME